MAFVRLASSLVAALLVAACLAAGARADIADACVQCDLLYAGTCSGQLYEIDPDAGTSVLVGNLPAVLFDLALSEAGVLYGNLGTLHAIDGCTGGGVAVGALGGNGLAGRVDDPGLYAQGPPLQRWEAGMTVTVGGAIGPAPPFWCGTSSGDLAQRPADGLFYSTLACGSCAGGDRLVAIDPATGDVVLDVGCVIDETGAARGLLYGVAFDASDRLWAVDGFDNGQILEIDPDTALAQRVFVTGGFSCGYGLASVPCPLAGPPTCDAGGPYVVDCAGAAPCDGGFQVVLDGSGSAAADLGALTHEWVVTCGAETRTAAGEHPDLCLPLACEDPCAVELTVTDAAGLSASCSTTVAVVDDVPPLLATGAEPLFQAAVWPPSHGYVVFAVADAVSAVDACTAVTLAASGCASDQPEEVHQGATGDGGDGGNGDGRFLEDCVISEDGTLFAVRAERLGACGADSARTYTLAITAWDECGNAATGTGTVRVDHDRSGGPAGPSPSGHALPPHAPPPFPYVHATSYGAGCGG
jgi:hypothetical protein